MAEALAQHEDLTLLVTGAQGFLGRHLVAHVLAAAPAVRVVGIGRSTRLDDCFTHETRVCGRSIPAPAPADVLVAPGHPRYQYHALDIANETEMVRLIRATRPTWIVHLASVLRDSNPDELIRINVEGTLRLLLALHQSGHVPHRLVLASSGSIYGRLTSGQLPVREETPCAPCDPYAASKLAAERLVATLAEAYAVPLSITRVFNLVGPGQDERHVTACVARQLAAIAIVAADPQVEMGTLSTTRDFIDAHDAADALWLLARHNGQAGIYNVASGIETPIGKVVELLIEAFGLTGRVRVRQESSRVADVPRQYADISKLAALGFRCRYSLDQSLCDMANYYTAIASSIASPIGAVHT
jgi:nucleoside-diphosphate-sugar epimerase